jgi:uncharacterized protein YukE
VSDVGPGNHLATLRYWFDVEALTYPDIPAPGKARSLRYADAMPWSRAVEGSVPDDHTYFVYFGLIGKNALESELLDMFQVQPDAESFSGNHVRNAQGKTFLCAIEVAFDGTPIASSFQMAAFCVAFAERKNGKRIGYSALLDALKGRIDDLAATSPSGIADAHWFEQVTGFLIDALAWQPRALMAREQVCVHRVSLLGRDGKKLSWMPEMEPVNSFYLDDLERICLAAENGRHSTQIARFLGESKRDDDNPDGRERASTRIDIIGFAAVNEALSAKRFPVGRWPTKFPLFLMQQVAVNKSLQVLADGGLFSVNGPPGTGKTTLLMDVIAARIVERAMLLATFHHPERAFSRTDAIIDYPPNATGQLFKGGCHSIDERLLDCGIVVASANNKAVENITLDLPNGEKVAPQPLLFDGARFDYFAAVAESILNDDPGGKSAGNAIDVDACRDEPDGEAGGGAHEQIACWGLVSVRLGSMKNCKQVAKRLGKFEKSSFESALDRLPALDWNAARMQFNVALEKVQQMQDAIARHDAALVTLRQVQDQLASARSAAAVADMRHQEAQGTLESVINRLAQCLSDLACNVNERELLVLEWPWWRRLMSRLFRRPDVDRFNVLREKMAQHGDRLTDERSTLARSRVQADANARKSDQALALADAAVACCENDVARCELLQGELRAQLGAAAFDPAQFRQWSVEQQQMSLPRSNAAYHAARADVFIAAMHLHKAFLKNAGKAFKTNFQLALAMLKQDPFIQPHLAAMAPHLWATFFLAVPVVSSTFASISRCFRDLGEGQIGLLLVDEAGQAVPSHALGAIWRSRRALIVGDPLQVEPFIGMDSKLDRGMLAYHGAPEQHSLTNHSVQLLADSANRFGANIVQHDGSELWVGAPLRVHRRCAEPMFSLSNAIAYNGKMVSGVSRDVEKTATMERPLLGPSRWLDVSSDAFDEHYSVIEGAAAVDIVIAYANNGWVAKSDRLPDLFLISPFKSVAQALTKALIDSAELWAKPGAGAIEEKTLSAWLKERVGTVHTFQGKECDTVVLVLGGKTPGARNWAGSKPNIINVAITRARRRLYVIGDRQAWSQTVFGEKLAEAVQGTSENP